MPLLCSIKNYAWYNYILEDPDPKYKRIFIENQAYNTSNLIPRREFFYWQSTADAQQTGANFYEFAPCDVDGKFGTSWSDTRTAWYGGIGKTDPWLLCLDYNYNPRRMFYSQETDCLFINYYRDISTADIRSDWWIGKDMCNAATFSVATNSYLVTPLYKWDKPKENKQGNSLNLICFNHDNTATNIARFTFTPGAAPTYTNIASTNIPFFIGNDDTGAGYFLNYNLTTGNYDISVVNVDGDIASNTLIQVAQGVSYVNTIYQFPSNLKHDSDTRKVFYAPFHQNRLNPVRIIWDKVTNRFDYSPCTTVFPGGNDWDTYFSFPTTSNYAVDASNNWWMKFHVFSQSGNNYITLCTSEKCIHNFPTERWNASQKQRNWITFSIGSGTSDNVLTYHSTFSWPTAIEMPRAWVPTNTIGNKMLVMQTGKTVYMDFDTVTGWEITNTQSIDARSYAIDSTGRIYLNTRGQASAVQTSTTADNIRGNGWNETFIFDPLLTVRDVNLEIANTLQEYSGNTIETYMQVSADNARLLSRYGSFDRFNPSPVSPFNNNYCFWFQSANSDRVISSNSDDFNFRTGDFTIEFWIRSITAWTSQTASAGIVGQKFNDTSQGWQVYRNSTFTDKLTFRFAGTTEAVSSGTVDATTWQHWAIVRNSGVITIYRAGVSSNTITSSADIYDFTGQFEIGRNQSAAVFYNGWISNLRICKGLAVYTGNFTVPTSPLQSTQVSDTNISAITNQCVFLGANSDKIVDNRPFYSTSLQLYSLNNNLKFNHGLANLTSETTVSTSSSEKTNVAISIVNSGPTYVKASNRLGPSWVTPSGPINNTSVYETQTISYSVNATGDQPITYSVDSGILPTGITFDANTATVSGTLPYETDTTTYSFIIRATDINGYYTGRQFSITNNIDYITWNSLTANQIVYFPSNNYTSITLNATSVLFNTISYSTPNALPTGVTLSGNTISGTPTVTGYDETILIYANSAITDTVTTIPIRLIASDVPSITGGTISTVTDNGVSYKVHTFTTSGSLEVSNTTFLDADVLVVAGGAPGGSSSAGGGGGGAGGMMYGDYALPTGTYTATVGGAAANSSLTSSSVNIYTIAGGYGRGGGAGYPGGSGGGGGGSSGGGGGATTQFSTYGYGYGNVGGSTGTGGTAAGGGGAGGTASGSWSSTGGAGKVWPGDGQTYAAGGNGVFGGDNLSGTPGPANSGNGGGGNDGPGGSVGSGGSGIIKVKYPFSYDSISWVYPTEDQFVFWNSNTSNSLTFNVSSNFSRNITYTTSNTLPNGVTISGNTLSGTPTDPLYDSNVYITATSAGLSTTRRFRLVVSNV